MAAFTSLTTPNNTTATGETKKKEVSFCLLELKQNKREFLFLLSYFVVSKLVTK